MKQKNKWIFYYLTSGTKEIKNIRIPFFIIIFLFLVFLASLGGLYRSVKLILTYGYARYGLYHEKIENKNLLQKLTFLKKFFETYQNNMSDYIAFEDNTRLKLGMNSIDNDIRQAGIGGKPSIKQMVDKMFDDPLVKYAGNLERDVASLFRQICIQDTTFASMAEQVEIQYNRWVQRPSIWPTKGRVTSGFGYRFHPLMQKKMFHEGIDIANQTWTPVYSTANGIVSFAGYKGNYGNAIIIDHKGSGYSTLYAHLQEHCVKINQKIKRGEKIGYLGNTGRSTGPHLHYEVRKLSRQVNPKEYILPTDVIVD